MRPTPEAADIKDNFGATRGNCGAALSLALIPPGAMPLPDEHGTCD
jgi:hypothetical protein